MGLAGLPAAYIFSHAQEMGNTMHSPYLADAKIIALRKVACTHNISVGAGSRGRNVPQAKGVSQFMQDISTLFSYGELVLQDRVGPDGGDSGGGSISQFQVPKS